MKPEIDVYVRLMSVDIIWYCLPLSRLSSGDDCFKGQTLYNAQVLLKWVMLKINVTCLGNCSSCHSVRDAVCYDEK